MKKVLIIIGKLVVGGAERVGRDIGFYADPEQYQIHYLVFGPEVGIYEQELLKKGYRVIHMPQPAENYPAHLRNLNALLRQERYQVIHSHTMFHSGWAMLSGKHWGVPIRIAHAHSIRSPEKRSLIRHLYEYTMRRMILRMATHYVACGWDAGCWLFGPDAFQTRGIRIPNGIPLAPFAFVREKRTRLRRQLGLEDRFVVGHAGHLAPVKNQRFLLELMPELIRRKPNALLLLLGEGPQRAELEETVHHLGLQPHVWMPGNVPNVEDFLNVMDVFAFPSLYEGMPLALLETQANGLPCIVSDQVPKDVYLTDLLTTLSLEDPGSWITRLCQTRRSCPEVYFQRMQSAGGDLSHMLDKIYKLYEDG